MKKVILFIAIALIGTTYTADAQYGRKKESKIRVVYDTGKPNSAPYKPINDGTDGVMGKDTLIQNSRGLYRNINTNSGIQLPPSNGSRRTL